MNPTCRKTLTPLLLGILLLFPASHLFADTEVLDSETGMVRIFVEDENGAFVPNAHVYIIDARNITYLQSDSLGSVSATLQKGKYIVSSAQTKRQADWIDRFASPQAFVRVMPKDMTTIILTLRPIEDPILNLPITTLKKIGVADEVAKYLN